MVPLRIVILAPPCYELPPAGYGGTELVCFNLAEGLVKLGHDVHLIGTGAHRTRAEFHLTFREPVGEGRLDQSQMEIRHIARAARFLRRERFDVIHDHTGLGLLATASCRTPTLATVHGALSGSDSQYDLWRDLTELAPLVAISEAQRSHAPTFEWLGTVHNGIDISRFPYQSSKQGYLLFLGRLSREKGVLHAIDAALETGKPLVIAGVPTVEEEKRYFELEVRPRLSGNINWVGEVGGRTKADLLANASALLFPITWNEPFGLVMIEAMACGTPVIAFRAGSVDEVVLDGVTGCICDSPLELAEGIRRALDLNPLDCRRRVESCFSVDVMAHGYERLYRQLQDGCPEMRAGRPGRATGRGAAVPPSSDKLVGEVTPKND